MLMYDADSLLRKVPLSALISYTWHSALWSAILELDPNKVCHRLDEATRAIDERMKMPIEPDDSEHRAIQEARSGISMLKAVASTSNRRLC
jgi:hypothetical protein